LDTIQEMNELLNNKTIKYVFVKNDDLVFVFTDNTEIHIDKKENEWGHLFYN
jgi:hypothetical protein